MIFGGICCCSVTALCTADLFPPDFCAAVERLQSGAPVHPSAASRAAIRRGLGAPVEALFQEFDNIPVASGSIAQVRAGDGVTG
jgi:predicted unusual protein kinase regulating ubiquinone biosynthesis (AarF/ABC1/UbiB family)